MLIVIEGIDGCGKSTVAGELALSLKGEVISFPNDKGYTGPMIREYLRGEWHVTSVKTRWPEMPEECVWAGGGALALQCMQIANRMEVMPQLVQASGNKWKHLVLARYWQSGWVYGQFDGLSEKFLTEVHRSMAPADLNILLELPPEEAMRRREARDGKKPPEIYESKLESLTKAAELYRRLWDSRSGINWKSVNAGESLNYVIEKCEQLVFECRKAEGLC